MEAAQFLKSDTDSFLMGALSSKQWETCYMQAIQQPASLAPGMRGAPARSSPHPQSLQDTFSCEKHLPSKPLKIQGLGLAAWPTG